MEKMGHQIHKASNLRVSRRDFVRVGLLAAGAVALLQPALIVAASSCGEEKSDGLVPQGFIRIRPLPTENYSPSFHRLCQRARFGSMAAVVKAVKNVRQGFEFYWEPAIPA